MASSVVWPRIGHIRRRNAASTSVAKAHGSPVPRLPWPTASKLTAVCPAAAKRLSIGIVCSADPPRCDIHSTTSPLIP